MPQPNPQNQDETAPRKQRVHLIPTCPSGFITEAEFARQIGKHLLTVQRQRAERNCPAYLKVGMSVFYRQAAIDKWLSAKEFDPSKPKKLTRRRKA